MKILHTTDITTKIYQDALSIRREVFIEGQGVPEAIEIDRNENQCIHFVLYDLKDQPAATVRLLPDPKQPLVTLQRMAVRNSYQGHGLGSKLLQEAETYAHAHDYQHITLHAQMSALEFYTKQDYQIKGQPFMEAGIEHVTVEKNV